MRWVVTDLDAANIAFVWIVAWTLEKSPSVTIASRPRSKYDVCTGNGCMATVPKTRTCIRQAVFLQHDESTTHMWYPATVNLKEFRGIYNPGTHVLKCPSLHRGRGVSLTTNNSIQCPGEWWVQKRIYSTSCGSFSTCTIRFYAAIYNDVIGKAHAYMDSQYALQLFSNAFRTNIAQRESDQRVFSCQDMRNVAICDQAYHFLTQHACSLIPIPVYSTWNVVAADTMIDANGQLRVLEVNAMPSMNCAGMTKETCAERVSQISSIISKMRGNDSSHRRWKPLDVERCALRS